MQYQPIRQNQRIISGSRSFDATFLEVNGGSYEGREIKVSFWRMTIILISLLFFLVQSAIEFICQILYPRHCWMIDHSGTPRRLRWPQTIR